MPVVKIVDVVATQREVHVPAKCPECGTSLTNGAPLSERQVTDASRPSRLARRSDSKDLDGNEGNGTIHDYRSCWEFANGDDNFFWGPISLTCECGCTRASGKLELNLLGEAGEQSTAASCLEVNETVAGALASDQVNWCRARLLHALAGAAKQGVLAEVVQELLPDDGGEITHRLIDSLKATGWMR
jgi:hypothetical protein